MTAAAAAPAPVFRAHGNAYNIFILVLTLLSLVVMVLLLLPLSQPVHDALFFYDNVLCFVFLGDFLYNLTGSRPRRDYFVERRGWLDLLGSIPTLGFFPITALFRLARLSRLARITRALRGQNQKELVRDVVENRGQYALFITLMLVMLVLTFGSVLVLMFEARDPQHANIKTGGDALWWAFVTITTVGYGDFFPVTTGGRAIAVGVMFAGIGVIGALASILASILVSSPSPDASQAPATPATDATPDSTGPDSPLLTQLGLLRDEMAAARAELDRTRGELADLRGVLANAGPTGGQAIGPTGGQTMGPTGSQATGKAS
ncbi:MAG: potassium channel family protein [Chloroflexota bacterium]